MIRPAVSHQSSKQRLSPQGASEMTSTGTTTATTATLASTASGPPTADGATYVSLVSLNSTFVKKHVELPQEPETLRVGRQTNKVTSPAATNLYFDSKVLSRQHAEAWADKYGRVFIRDVKSSNGTFVNGRRLSPEGVESEPCELQIDDILELGIDIVNEENKSIIHKKVSARVSDISPAPGATSAATQQGQPLDTYEDVGLEPSHLTQDSALLLDLANSTGSVPDVEVLLRMLSTELKAIRATNADLLSTSSEFSKLRQAFFLNPNGEETTGVGPVVSGSVAGSGAEKESSCQADVLTRYGMQEQEPTISSVVRNMVRSSGQDNSAPNGEQQSQEVARRAIGQDQLQHRTDHSRQISTPAQQMASTQADHDDDEQIPDDITAVPNEDASVCSLGSCADTGPDYTELQRLLREAQSNVEMWRARAELAENRLVEQKALPKAPEPRGLRAPHLLHWIPGLDRRVWAPFISSAGVFLAGMSFMWIVDIFANSQGQT